MSGGGGSGSVLVSGCDSVLVRVLVSVLVSDVVM